MHGCLNVALLGSSKGGVCVMFLGAPSTSFTWEAKSMFSNNLIALQRNRHTWLAKSPTILHRMAGLLVWLWRWVNKLIIACWCWCNSLFFTFIKLRWPHYNNYFKWLVLLAALVSLLINLVKILCILFNGFLFILYKNGMSKKCFEVSRKCGFSDLQRVDGGSCLK